MIFKKLMIGIVMVLALICSRGISRGDVVELSPGQILIEAGVGVLDYGDFIVATSHKRIKHYEILLHTPGGVAYTCLAIMNHIELLQSRGITFTTIANGFAMSAGTYIFMMGNERIVYEGSEFMFHGSLSQKTQANRDWMKREQTEKYNNLFRIDSWLRMMLKRKMNWSDDIIKYLIDGGDQQFMSAEKAYGMGFATVYISFNKQRQNIH